MTLMVKELKMSSQVFFLFIYLSFVDLHWFCTFFSNPYLFVAGKLLNVFLV